ncbi:MAG: cell division protein FtsA [Deltaproteobacteria bacterium]|nr:MAG: cell division protein FtsA [Deltaproteobacteria bacterium]
MIEEKDKQDEYEEFLENEGAGQSAEENEILDRSFEELRKPGELVVGLDIGTTKICCVVGEAREDGVEVIGVGTAASLGIKKGVVVNIESTVKAIREAVRMAREDADCELCQVYVGIAGDHIKGFNSPGIIVLNNRKIGPDDINDVITAASTVKISENQQVIHVMPQEYMVDDHTGIQNAVGMTGVRLATNVHMVTADKNAVDNLYTCCNMAGLEVAGFALESIASAEAALSDDELELGVALLDIGGGTTDLAVFYDGTIRHTCEFAIGGHYLTFDLAESFRTTMQDAERLKRDYGNALPDTIKPNLVVDVPTVGHREPTPITQRLLVEIINARVVEILKMVNKELVVSGNKSCIKGGLVITGGTALLANLVELAEEMFELPVRIGYPVNISGDIDKLKNPGFTTAAGLTIYGSKHNVHGIVREKSFFDRIMGWIKR